MDETEEIEDTNPTHELYQDGNQPEQNQASAGQDGTSASRYADEDADISYSTMAAHGGDDGFAPSRGGEQGNSSGHASLAQIDAREACSR
jgi:hypothetical protein